MTLIVKSNIKKAVKDLQPEGEEITSVAEEVGTELEKKVKEILGSAISRARANQRRTLQARDW